MERSDIRVLPASMDRPPHQARRPMRVRGDTARRCFGVRHGLATSGLLSRISPYRVPKGVHARLRRPLDARERALGSSGLPAHPGWWWCNASFCGGAPIR